MRRSFRRDLLVTVPPPPPPRKKAVHKKKNPSTRCPALARLYREFADRMLVEFDIKELAREVGILSNSVRRWKYGYPPHRDLLWPIARYYATRMQEDEKRVHARIVQTLEEWRKQ